MILLYIWVCLGSTVPGSSVPKSALSLGAFCPWVHAVFGYPAHGSSVPLGLFSLCLLCLGMLLLVYSIPGSALSWVSCP